MSVSTPAGNDCGRFSRVIAGCLLTLGLYTGPAIAQTPCPLPTFPNTFPTTISANSSANNCGIAVTYVAASSSSSDALKFNLTGATVDSGIGTGSTHVFRRGITHIVVTATNSCGSASKAFDLTVTDGIAPQISATPNITVNSSPTTCGAVVTYATPTATDNCIDCNETFMAGLGYTKLGELNQHSYFSIPGTMSWLTADSIASSFGGYLVSIGSAAEDQYVGSLIGTSTPTWMGFTDRDEEGTWRWTSGEAVTYTNWCSDQPDDWLTGQDYGLLNSLGIFVSNNCWDDVHSPTRTGTDIHNNFNAIFEINSCASALQRTAGLASGSTFPVGTTVVTYKATDASGNFTTQSFNVTVIDVTKPTLTCPQDFTLPANSTNTNPSVTGQATATDNCGTPAVTYTDAVSGNVTTRTWKATDVNGNISECVQKITIPVSSAVCDYTMVAKKEIHLHENSTVYGGVGVTNSNGKVHVQKNSAVPAPGFVKAATINIANDAVVDNPIYSPATPTLPTMLYPSNASTSSLSNLVITSNGTNNNNYKDLTVDNGLTVTLGGNLYRKIKIKKNSTVTFSQSDITLESLDIDDNVTLLFSGATNIRIKDRAKFHKAAIVNPSPSKKLVFYVDDPLTTNDNDEKFDVDGDGTTFVGSVMMPTGKLRVHGGGKLPITTMKGFYYAERIQSDGKDVVWMGDCTNAPLRMINNSAAQHQSGEGAAYGVMIYPNPTNGEFNVQFESVTENAEVRLTDLQGRLVESRTVTTDQMPSISFSLAGKSTGVYLLEVRQGSMTRMYKVMVQ